MGRYTNHSVDIPVIRKMIDEYNTSRISIDEICEKYSIKRSTFIYYKNTSARLNNMTDNELFNDKPKKQRGGSINVEIIPSQPISNPLINNIKSFIQPEIKKQSHIPLPIQKHQYKVRDLDELEKQIAERVKREFQ